MLDSRTLPLFPDQPVAAERPPHTAPRPALRKKELSPKRQRGDVVVRPLPTRELLNRCDNPKMPFAWTINPYRGCEFACRYCYARPSHEYLGYARGDVFEAFDREIWAKIGAAASLEAEKLLDAAQEGSIAIGTATDPYQSAEESLRLTRAILERLMRVPGLDVSITTKSPLVARDVDLLVALSAKSRVRVHVSITTADDALARRLEPRAPSSSRRLETIRLLAKAGVETRVNLMPIVPFVTDDESSIRATLRAAKEAGARAAVANPMFVPRAWWKEGWDRIVEGFPELEQRFAPFRRDPARFEALRETIQARAILLVHEAGLDPPERERPPAADRQAAIWGSEPDWRPRRRAQRGGRRSVARTRLAARLVRAEATPDRGATVSTEPPRRRPTEGHGAPAVAELVRSPALW